VSRLLLCCRNHPDDAKVAAQVDAYVVWRYGGEQFEGWKGRFWMHLLGGFAVGAAACCM
jgi:hypothetical protein